MSAVIKGKGVFWSVGSLTITAGLVGTPLFFTQAADLTRSSERRNIMDNGGTNRSLVYFGGMKQLKFSCVPYGDTTLAGGAASGEALTPTPGTKVTFTDDSGTIIAGNWNVVTANQRRTVDNVVVIDLDLEQGDEGIDLTTTIA